MACDHIRALGLSKAGKWNEAHRLVQRHSDRLSCRIHAYLHRLEGDLRNARYWYRRADESMPGNTLEEGLSRLYQEIKPARKSNRK